jgi:hypothetical protein
VLEFRGPIAARSGKNHKNSFSAQPYGASHRVFARSARYRNRVSRRKSEAFGETTDGHGKTTSACELAMSSPQIAPCVASLDEPRRGFVYNQLSEMRRLALVVCHAVRDGFVARFVFGTGLGKFPLARSRSAL